MKEPEEGFAPVSGGVFAAGALAISMIGILVIGLFPAPLFNLAGEAARALLQ
jgi:hypothetical protein